MHVGVVIPAYNAASWIGDAIASLLAQTHRDWTLVVVDDGSADGTGDVVAGFSDDRIRLIRQANAGVSAARNRGALLPLSSSRSLAHCCPVKAVGEDWRCSSVMAGLGLAKPRHDDREALLFLDSDDWLALDALARLVAALDASPDAVASCGAYMFVNTNRVGIPPSGDLLAPLLVRNLFANGGHVLLRSQAVRAAGGFRADISYGEDWEFWVRIALQGPFASTGDKVPLLFVRRHQSGAYSRLAADPASFEPCMNAIFTNPALLTRFGARRLAAIRRRTEAENDWIIGRELIRHDSRRHGREWLRRSVVRNPSAKRIALLAASQVLPLLPTRWHGPFQSYCFTTCASSRARRPAPG